MKTTRINKSRVFSIYCKCRNSAQSRLKNISQHDGRALVLCSRAHLKPIKL